MLSIVVGIGAGFGAWVFWKLIEYCSWFFFKGGATAFGFMGDYYVIVLPLAGGLILGPIIYFFAREAKGEGPPEVMKAIAADKGRIRQRTAVVKIVASSICIGSGGSVGREGPIAQIGASIGSTIGQRFKLNDEWVKTLLLCGAAGGISATFNAPIAGAFFAFEVLQRKARMRNALFIIISSVAACLIANLVVYTDEHPAPFSLMTYTLQSPWEILSYMLLGIIAGVTAYGFMKFFYKCDSFINKVKFPSYLKPAAGGLIIGLIGYFYPDIFGVGYGVHYGPGGELLTTGGIDHALMGQLTLGTLLALFALKIIATSITLGSGGSGGIFAPSLFIGAMLGGAFGMISQELVPGITAPVGAYSLVGMGTFFGAAIGGPLTAIFIVFEITRDYAVILPIIAAVAFSTITFNRLSSETMYTTRLQQQGINLHKIEEPDAMKTLTVGDIMTRDFPTVPPDMPIAELAKKLEKTGHHGFPVVDNDGRLYGVVTMTDLEEGLKQQPDDLKVSDIATINPITAYPDQSVHDILLRLGTKDVANVGRIPVVSRNDPLRLLGVLRRHDIIRAYTKTASEAKKRGQT
ncbi:MAG: chloride channel protein [Chloroflexota bacterium]|nr:chloride channel protein [Chloroflexota bacterium]